MNHGIQSLSEVTHLLNELKAIERRLDSANTVLIKLILRITRSTKAKMSKLVLRPLKIR